VQAMFVTVQSGTQLLGAPADGSSRSTSFSGSKARRS